VFSHLCQTSDEPVLCQHRLTKPVAFQPRELNRLLGCSAVLKSLRRGTICTRSSISRRAVSREHWASFAHFDVNRFWPTRRLALYRSEFHLLLLLEMNTATAEFVGRRVTCVSFAAPQGLLACRGEPPRPPVPIACNAEKCGSDHNSNQRRVNQHGRRKRKSDHLHN